MIFSPEKALEAWEHHFPYFLEIKEGPRHSCVLFHIVGIPNSLLGYSHVHVTHSLYSHVTLVNIPMSYGSAIPLLTVYPKASIFHGRETFMTMFITVLLTVARKWDHTIGPSVGEWINKIWY